MAVHVQADSPLMTGSDALTFPSVIDGRSNGLSYSSLQFFLMLAIIQRIYIAALILFCPSYNIHNSSMVICYSVYESFKLLD